MGFVWGSLRRERLVCDYFRINVEVLDSSDDREKGKEIFRG